MKTITHSELVEMIKERHGALLIGIEALTDARARKNPYGKIYKKVRAVGTVGANYERAVNRELAAIGQMPIFEAQPLPWGKWLVVNKIIENKGELYLRTQTTSTQRRKSPAKVLRYRSANDHTLTPKQVLKYLPGAVEAFTQTEAGLEDVEQQVWVRNYKFSSLLRIRINGQTFRVLSEEQILESVGTLTATKTVN